MTTYEQKLVQEQQEILAKRKYRAGLKREEFREVVEVLKRALESAEAKYLEAFNQFNNL